MRDKNINFFSDISLNGLQFNDVNIKDENFTNKGICTVKNDISAIPTASSELIGSCFLYTGESTETYKKNTIYQCQEGGWKEIEHEAINVVDTLPATSEENKIYLNTTDSSLHKCISNNEFKFLGYVKALADYDKNNIKGNIFYYNKNDSDTDFGIVYYDGEKVTSIVRKSKLDYLSNVNINSSANGDVLAYSDNNWINQSNIFPTSSTTSIDLGKLSANTDISSKTPLEVLSMILFGNVNNNLTLNEVDTLYKKGSKATIAMTATCKATTGTTLSKIQWYSNDKLVHEETLSGESATPTYTYTDLSEKTVIKAILTLSNSKTTSAEVTIKFISPSYYGTADSLSEILLESKSTTLSYTGTMIQPIYKYPSEYGELSSITNSGGSDSYIDSFALTTETIDEVEYNVYTKIVASTHNDFQYVFS